MDKRGRPRLPASQRQSEWVRFVLRPATYERMLTLAERENRSLSSVAREAVENYLEEKDA